MQNDQWIPVPEPYTPQRIRAWHLLVGIPVGLALGFFVVWLLA